MKKILLTVAIAFSTANLFAQANCTPDLSCLPGGATQGICPDSVSAITMLTGVVNQPLSGTFSIKIPATASAAGQTFNLNQFAVTEVTVNVNGSDVALSTIGLDYDGSGSNSTTSGSGIGSYTMTHHCYWAAPSNACVVVSGTPNQVGTFPVTIKSKARAFVVISNVWQDAPIDKSYKITVLPDPNGLVATLSEGLFSVNANVPNPFDTKTAISFYNPVASKVKLNVYNVLGKQVFNDEINTHAGDNTYTFNAENLASGVYIYTLNNGGTTISKRMVVDKK